MLDDSIADEHNWFVGDIDERPASIAQAGDRHSLALRREPADGFSGRGAVQRSGRVSWLQDYDLCLTGIDTYCGDAPAFEGRSEAVPFAIGHFATAAE